MYEVEAKVALTPSDFKRLKETVSKIGKFTGESLKKDTYYGDTKIIHMRTRDEEGGVVFCLKNKTLIDGVEANTEMEWEIANKKKWEKILSKSGIRPSVKKVKKTEAYDYKGFHIELNHIRTLGYFLEIEKIVNKKENIPKAKQELIDLFKQLGYSQKDFEKKYYLELLAEKNRNS